VRGGKGSKDRSTLLAETGREELRARLQESEALYRADRAAKLAGVWLPDGVERKYPNAGCELGWFWVFPSHTLSTDPRAGTTEARHLSALRAGARVRAQQGGHGSQEVQAHRPAGGRRLGRVRCWSAPRHERPAA